MPAPRTTPHRPHLPRARLTGWAVFWVLIYVGSPVFFLGLALDLLIQWVSGRCLGMWCFL
jgi:hypothetical protein